MTERMPALFIGHGSPMNMIQKNTYTEAFQRLGRELPEPAAILAVSAHWQTPSTEIVASPRPKQIFDFSGFPDELYKIHYTPEGSPALAADVARKAANVSETGEWGLDHGAWSVLHHMYPLQNIPAFQLSLSRQLAPLDHLRVAREIRYLREKGVLIMGSGNIVHNLRQIDWNPDAKPHDWAVDFENFVLETLAAQNLSAEEKVERVFASPQLRLAHPTVEHLLPLIYVLGAADETEAPVVQARGIQNAAVSMAAIQF